MTGNGHYLVILIQKWGLRVVAFVIVSTHQDDVNQVACSRARSKALMCCRSSTHATSQPQPTTAMNACLKRCYIAQALGELSVSASLLAKKGLLCIGQKFNFISFNL